jgi:AraC-like DNA-binding protein
MVQVLTGDRFFKPDFPIFLNRETESFKVKYHTHDFIEICLVEEGRGFQFIGDQTIPVQKGDIFLLPIGTSHVFRPSSPQSTEPLVICNCIFQLEAIRDVKDWIPSQSELYRVLYSPQELKQGWYYYQDKHNRLSQMFQMAYLEFHQQFSEHRTMLKTILLQILILLHRMQSEVTNADKLQSTNRYREKVEDMIQFIHHHAHEQLTLKDMASSSSISVNHLQQLFKQATGQTFNRYVQHVRIQRSCVMLETTDLPVNEIVGRVGYTDLKFFHALFRKLTGCTPLQYRTKALKIGE